ncbi:MAG: hypothetical protein PUC12_03235 [Clostridiales bacterium]|nr:hypothetical protein [Clostridiales bacterium]
MEPEGYRGKKNSEKYYEILCFCKSGGFLYINKNVMGMITKM